MECSNNLETITFQVGNIWFPVLKTISYNSKIYHQLQLKYSVICDEIVQKKISDFCYKRGIQNPNFIDVKSLDDGNLLSDLKCVFKHDGGNREEFEFNCFARFFYIKNYMERKSILKIFHIDSDIALSKKFILEMNSFKKLTKDSLLLFNKNTTPVSVWGLNKMREYCDFGINEYFKKDLSIHRFCDMDMLASFIENKKIKYFNLSSSNHITGINFIKNLGNDLSILPWFLSSTPEYDKFSRNIPLEVFIKFAKTIQIADNNFSSKNEYMPFIHFQSWSKKVVKEMDKFLGEKF